MKRWNSKIFCLALGTMLLAVGFRANAQQPAKVWRIGYLSPVSSSRDSARRERFLRGLREHGYFR
jgi:hypothetical protein